MMLCIGDVLNSEVLEEVCAEIETLTFVDGRATAGWAARLVKDNEQAEAGTRVDALRRRISAQILDNELFQIAVRPKALTPLLISRYGPGKQYGTHVDDALMQGMRTDAAFPLFLSAPRQLRRRGACDRNQRGGAALQTPGWVDDNLSGD